MIEFDVPTMLFIAIFVLFMTASLVMVASLQLRRDPCLAWVSIGLYLACIGFSLTALRIVPIWELQVIWLGNIFLISAHACVWSAVRRFSNKKIYWSTFFAGAVIWTILCLFPSFMDRPAIRVLVYSLICVFYMGSAAIRVLYYWNKNFWTIMPMAVIMFAYILIYLYRALYWQTEYQFWTQRNDSALTIFSSLLISIGLSFSIMTLVKGREEERYRNASLQDELTGLHNRRALFEQAIPLLESSKQRQQQVALLMFDLDWFKKINDQFGHHSGDMVLANFGKVLTKNLRKQDFSARIGGEEFVALLIDVDINQAVDLAKRINKELNYKIDNTHIPITVSVGIAMTGDVGYYLEDLLKAADAALYKAKADGRNCTRSWTKELNNELKTNSSLI